MKDILLRQNCVDKLLYIIILLLIARPISSSSTDSNQYSFRVNIKREESVISEMDFIHKYTKKRIDLSVVTDNKEGVKTKMVKEKNPIFEQYLYDFKSVQFVGQVAVGSKKQVMKIIFDSGSSILWFSAPKDPYAFNKKTFKCDEFYSSTCKKSEKGPEIGPKTMIYGSGAILGETVYDDIWIPNIPFDSELPVDANQEKLERTGQYLTIHKKVLQYVPITNQNSNTKWGHIESQPFLLVTKSPGMEIVKADGVLGLGPKDGFIESILTTMKKQGVIKKQLFSFFFSVDEKIKPSEFILGDYDRDFVKNSKYPMNWISILPNSEHWTTKFDAMMIGNNAIVSSNNKIILDSGSSWILLFTYDFNMYKILAERVGISCNLSSGTLICGKTVRYQDWSINDLPSLSFVMNKNKYSININLLVGQCINKTVEGDLIKYCMLKVKFMNVGFRI